ncbi:MAG TPA: ABC transporter permease subunit [Tepidisphaeraceae bacterium]|jgi:ABC-type transport system involved in multi-copper enzyme maturation permease subunit
MMRQTLAIFVDAYRDLNSRKLFWVTLVLSGVFVAAFVLLGVDDKGVQFATRHFDMPKTQAVYMYKYIFRLAVIGIWLTWAATILALISTAGIFPDLIAGGSIDLYLSKPLSRARLFATRYVAGLTFVLLQVMVVTLGGFLVLGWRGQTWLPQLFLAIPIVICFFSYLFGICVFFDVLTRSTVAALLLTIGTWGLLAGVDMLEPFLLNQYNIFIHEADRLDADADDPSELSIPGNKSKLSMPTPSERAQTARDIAGRIKVFQRIVYGIKTITPKTTDTTDLLSRYVFTDEEVESSLNPPARQRGATRREGGPPFDDQSAKEASRESSREYRGRSIAWVVGTSLVFEVVLVTFAGWMFCRRDY